jgi:adenylate kinase
MDLILFGPPGAGKGTQGALLADKLGLARISTGDVLREAARAGTPLGLRAKRIMESGELVPDDVILGLVGDSIVSAEASGGTIFDGFPRTRPQAESLDRILGDLGRPLTAVLVLEVEDEELVRRLAGRLSCPSCGAIYNVHVNPPRTGGTCDVCGHQLVQRADDDETTVRRRLHVYREQTAPLLAYYDARPVPVHRVNGSRDIEAVQDDLLGLLA